MALAALAASSAHALVITPVFDSSITSLANASAIEKAFDAAAAQFDKALSSPVTVHVTVSWGSVGGNPLPGGDIGASLDNLYDGFAYSDVKSYMAAAAALNPTDQVLALAVADLPSANPTKMSDFGIPYAEAKALGLLPANQALPDGFIGFENLPSYDFGTSGVVPKGEYDFEGLAAHEIAEVLGRMTGLQAGGVHWATPFDLFRYSAKGVSGFSYSRAAYFSIDRGATNLGAFDFTGGGDRSDWLATNGSGDIQDALLPSGKRLSLGASDLTALDALGWYARIDPGNALQIAGPLGGSAVPEPSAWALSILGLAMLGAGMRRKGGPLRARSA